jgi:hypothetical protein
MMGFGTAVLDSAQHKLFYHWSVLALRGASLTLIGLERPVWL